MSPRDDFPEGLSEKKGAEREPVAADAKAMADYFWHELIEKDDRNSPEEYPDMALITADEIEYIVAEAMDHVRQLAAVHPLASEQARAAVVGYISQTLLDDLNSNANAIGRIAAAAMFDDLIPLYAHPPVPIGEGIGIRKKLPTESDQNTEHQHSRLSSTSKGK